MPDMVSDFNLGRVLKKGSKLISGKLLYDVLDKIAFLGFSVPAELYTNSWPNPKVT